MVDEEKILARLEELQQLMDEVKADIKELMEKHRIEKQLAVGENLSNLLTKEEADSLALAVGDEHNGRVL